jgi:hypothetical protein
VSLAAIGALLVATLQGVGAVAVVVLVLMIGLSVGIDTFKLRPSGPKSLTVRNLDEALGQPATYLPPDTPRGTTDQLGHSRHVS